MSPRGRATNEPAETAIGSVRRVADHTAGLPTYYQFFYADEPYARASMDETILRYGNQVTAPGETYEYSSLGYGLLDDVIARTGSERCRAHGERPELLVTPDVIAEVCREFAAPFASKQIATGPAHRAWA